MKARRLLVFVLIAVVVLGLDWVLGVLSMKQVVPLYVFAVANIPFGLPHVWMESHWMGAHYEIGGAVVSEMWSFVTFFGTVSGQSVAYFLVWRYWRKRRSLGALTPREEA